MSAKRTNAGFTKLAEDDDHMSLLAECIGQMASVQDHAWFAPPELDLNFLYGKLDTVYCKHSRNSGER
jgi:hypothetical protein